MAFDQNKIKNKKLFSKRTFENEKVKSFSGRPKPKLLKSFSVDLKQNFIFPLAIMGE